MKDTPGKDKLVYLLTPCGLVKAFMTPKRSAGKKSYTIDLFAHGEVVLYAADSGNYLVNSISPDGFFYGIREDISRLYAAGYFASLSMYAAEDAETDTESLYSLLFYALEVLSSGADIKKVKPAYEFKISQLIGMTPCLEAEKKADEYYFAMADGRLFTHSVNSSFLLPRSAVFCIYNVLKADIGQDVFSHISDVDAELIYHVAQQYIIYHTERTFDSLKYLNGVI